jgi:hypothetical protein
MTTKTAPEPTKFFTPTVESGIPLPPVERKQRAKNNGAQIRWPFATMKVGDSLLVPNWAEPTRATAYVLKAKREKHLPETFKIEMRKTAQGYRVWRTA